MASNRTSERPRSLLVAGHVNVDRFLGVREFPTPDRTVPVESHRAALGGTAASIARVAASYGVTSGLVARVGTDFPVAFRTTLSEAGIDLRGLETVPSASTPTCFIVEDARGGQRTLIDQGPMDHAGRAPLPGAWLDEYAWLHVTTGDPAYQLRLVARARAAGLRVSADPAQEIHYRWKRGDFLRLLAESEILFGNGAEIDHAQEFVGVRSPRALLDHVPLVIRTEGKRGATAFSRAGILRVPGVRAKRRGSIVGAGDAFRGGFYAGWFEGESLEHALTAGTRAAARWIERTG